MRRLTELREEFLEPLINGASRAHRQTHGRRNLGGVRQCGGRRYLRASLGRTAVAKHEATAEKDKRLQFRIGINLGDVIVEEARISTEAA